MKKITVILMSLALVFSFGFGAFANNGLKNEAEYAIQPKTDMQGRQVKSVGEYFR